MVEVKFYDEVDDGVLKFAVIVARTDNKWVFCKHRERETYEIPGGHREKGEPISDTAKRELYEETGALEYRIKPVCAYSVAASNGGEKTYGMLYCAEILSFEQELRSEIEKILITEHLVDRWTYPQIQQG